MSSFSPVSSFFSSVPSGSSLLFSGPGTIEPLSFKPDVILLSPLTVTPTPTATATPTETTAPTAPTAPTDPTATPQPTVTVTQTVQPSAPAVQDVKLDADQFGAGILGLALLVTVSSAALVRGFRR